MTEIPVYDKSGTVVTTIQVDDELTHVSGRVSRGQTGAYYKGVGVPYRSHSSRERRGNDRLKSVCIPRHYGYEMVNPAWEGKTGIFQQQYQPYFSDWIGSCGVKELRIVETSKAFERSSVVVDDVVCWDADNAQYYFKLQYRCGRVKAVDQWSAADYLDLLVFMLQSDWNFPWDKAAINDVAVGGLVSDVADLFVSDELVHKLGTAYAGLYSLAKVRPELFEDVLTENSLSYTGDVDNIYMALWALDLAGIDVNPMLTTPEDMVYEHLIGNWLIQGRNCAYCERADFGDAVRQSYNTTFWDRVDPKKRDILAPHRQRPMNDIDVLTVKKGKK